jgi:hypothetical protein
MNPQNPHIQNKLPQVPQAPLAIEEKPRKLSPDETRKELQQAIKGSGEIVATAMTVFTLFPDTLVLDRAKLTLTKRHFFKTAEVMSIRIEDLLNITAEVDLFFGSIKVVSRIASMEPYTIGNFWRKEAIRMKRITQGYIIALQRNIDCSTLPAHELAGMLDKLGEDDHGGLTAAT